MAEGRFLSCTHCNRRILAWSDGNPYFRDERGRKRYAYHPDHENLARCVGNDEPHLCLACGARTKVDSLKPRTICRKCKAEALMPLWDLASHPCPACREGIFVVDPGGGPIS
jgi:DNA-directed RNA polymerase subunit RPC12/RpoP